MQKQLVLSYIIVSYILSKELRHFSAKGQFLDRFFGFRRFGHGMLPDSVILRTDTYASANPLIDINDLVFRFDLFRFDLSSVLTFHLASKASITSREQCDQNEQFFKVFATNYLTKVAQIFVALLEYFEKHHFKIKKILFGQLLRHLGNFYSNIWSNWQAATMSTSWN